MEFLDFLLFAIFAIYIVRSIARVVLPIVFQNVVNKANPPGAGGAGSRQQNYNTNTGKIKVDYIPKTNKNTVPDSEGEFVDYEEVK